MYHSHQQQPARIQGPRQDQPTRALPFQYDPYSRLVPNSMENDPLVDARLYRIPQRHGAKTLA